MAHKYLSIIDTLKDIVINAAIELANQDFTELPEAVENQDDLNLIINLKQRSFFFVDTPTYNHVQQVVALSTGASLHQIEPADIKGLTPVSIN
jgi:hypothetical protein